MLEAYPGVVESAGDGGHDDHSANPGDGKLILLCDAGHSNPPDPRSNSFGTDLRTVSD